MYAGYTRELAFLAEERATAYLHVYFSGNSERVKVTKTGALCPTFEAKRDNMMEQTQILSTVKCFFCWTMQSEAKSSQCDSSKKSDRAMMDEQKTQQCVLTAARRKMADFLQHVLAKFGYV